MVNNLFRFSDEEQIRYVAKLMGFDPNTDLKYLPTATIRDLIGKAERQAEIYLSDEIIKITKFGNKYKKLR